MQLLLILGLGHANMVEGGRRVRGLRSFARGYNERPQNLNRIKQEMRVGKGD